MLKNVVYLLITGISLSLLIQKNAFSQERSNVDFLVSLAQAKTADFNKSKLAAKDFALKNNIPLLLESEGVFAELMRIDEFNQPEYYITNNANAAVSIQTNKLYPNAGFGYSLTGLGETIYLWDAGAVLSTHQDLTGRVIQGDASPSAHSHSTHVAGTMISSGIVASSRGMAPAANLKAFDWNNDEAEMALEAANNALISNHSYGCVRGWLYLNNTWIWYGNPAISTQEDYLFGFYGTNARDWDIIANNAPYYLICKSAGNDRNEGPVNGDYPKDGPYDCLSDGAVSKNVITVGAVNDIPNSYSQASDVIMTNYSGWGPTDDGRIKPDVVANGASLYSTTSSGNTAYLSMSGTSMATPSVSGSLLLLQQHYHNLSTQYMQSATLKALAIHTADEAGSTAGPDYQFGWGLVNSFKAAQKITEDSLLNVIDELNLQAGDIYTRSIYSPGDSPLKVTISWNDPAGLAQTASLDPSTPNLVNDLNVKLFKDDVTYFPWKLNPADPGSPATRNMANHVDNVEQVLIDDPNQGFYTLVVDYNGTLNGGSQKFSIIISGITEEQSASSENSISGKLTYANNSSSPLNNTSLILKQGESTVGNDTTDMEGYFNFNKLESGTYLISGDCNKPWGGVNATDALLIMKHYMNIIALTGMNLRAADINGNGYISSTDAMLVTRRFSGLINSFSTGDWAFQNDSIVVNDAVDITKNIQAILVGDVDGSYNPDSKESPATEFITSEEIICSPGQVIKLPVKVSSNASIAALSLVIDLPDGVEKINEIHLSSNTPESDKLVYNEVGRQLMIAWFSLTPLKLTSGDEIFEISMKLSKNARQEDLALSLDAFSSLADENAIKLEGIDLMMPKLLLENHALVLGQNIPNPSNGLTTIQYQINSEAIVNLKIFNTFGECVESTTSMAKEGIHNLELNTLNYAPGIYYYKLEVNQQGLMSQETRKMIVPN